MPINPQHVLKAEFAVQLWGGILRSIAGPLLDCHHAAASSQLAGDNPVDRHQPAEGCFAGDDRSSGLKAGVFPRRGWKLPDRGTFDASWSRRRQTGAGLVATVF